jgi:hypothetical protein
MSIFVNNGHKQQFFCYLKKRQKHVAHIIFCIVMRESKFPQLMEIKPHTRSIPVAVQSEAWVCGHSLAGVGVSNPAGGMDICLL